MKTAQERVDEVMENYNGCGSHTALRGFLLRAFKEQDRDTRHACAEAVIQLPSSCQADCVKKDDAHNACMNVKAI